MTTKMTIATKQSKPTHRRSKRRHLLFAFALISTGLAAGNALGWPALRNSLIKEGTDLDETELGQIFTVGTWSLYGCRLFIGILRDRGNTATSWWGCGCGGTRITSCLALLAAAAGSLGLALADASDLVSLSASMVFVGIGGGVQLCMQPVAGLFEQSQGLILSSITGAFMVSAIVFLVLTSISDDRQSVFMGFAMLLLALVVVAAVILPAGQFVEEEDDEENVAVTLATEDTEAPTGETLPPIQVPVTNSHTQIGTETINQNNQVQVQNHAVSNDTSTSTSTEADESKGIKSSSFHRDLSLMEILKSTEYIWLLIYFSFTLTGLNYYIGAIGYQLEQKGDDDGKYTNIFVVLCAAVAILSPFPGKLSDHHGVGVLQGLALTGLSTSYFVLATDASLEIGQVIGFTIYAIARLMALSSFFINVANRFGYKYYGILVGGGLLLCATFSLVQLPLLRISANGGAVAVNMSFGVALSSLLPYCVWLGLRERRGESCMQK